ncbi:RNA-binding S4 domain-containing protein [Prochlorococcus sp. MIT 1307]|uniref:RNA-binding S4 domain-containing protein n=1 Tax=Prochlorococcus sp. MIT 1307 TaxID=3096219 RepID=UPI002A759536|nr:RNA-binding S4 domain-containing protein [Prochlorococcus sp. MIT 1307]
MKLDQFLKWEGLVSTGGEAKHVINTGQVSVNGSVELRRGRKLCHGDQVTLGNIKLIFNETDALGRRLASND